MSLVHSSKPRKQSEEPEQSEEKQILEELNIVFHGQIVIGQGGMGLKPFSLLKDERWCHFQSISTSIQTVPELRAGFFSQ